MLFKKKVVEVKKVDKLVLAKGLVSAATAMFVQAANEIDSANSLLIEVKDAANLERNDLVMRMSDLNFQDIRIESELKTNNDLKAQLSAFLPKVPSK